jgi:hypothetical protein
MSGSLLEKEFNQIITFTLEKNFTVEPKADIKRTYSIPDIILNEHYNLKIENSPSFEKFKEFYFDKKIPVLIEGI